MANDISYETLKNNKLKSQVILYAVIALMCIAVGAAIAGTGSSAGMIAGGLLAAGGGFYFGKMSYDILVDVKNERRCKQSYFTQIYKNMKVPTSWVNGDTAVDTDTDLDELTIITKAQFEGYGGVFLVSNTSTDSVGDNYDAYYIPGNAKAVLTKKLTPLTGQKRNRDSSDNVIAEKLYIAADAKTGVRVIARNDFDPNNRKDFTQNPAEQTDTTKTYDPPSSPSINGCPYA